VEGRRRRVTLGLVGGVVMLICMVFRAPSPAAAVTGFSDVPTTSPYYDAIIDLASRDIISGYGGGIFGPRDAVTRQQFAKMIVRTADYEVSESDICPFTDVVKSDASTFYPDNYVAVCAAHGITTGKTATKFDPYSNITRYQVVSMVVRAADDLQPRALVSPPSGWKGAWAADSTHGANAARAEYNGLLDGLDLVSLNPNGNMSRGEVAQVLHNLLGKLEAAEPPEASERPPHAEITDRQQRVLFAGGGLSVAIEYRLSHKTGVTVHLEIAEKGSADEHGRVVARTQETPGELRATLSWDGTGLDGKIVAENEYLAYVVTKNENGIQATSRPVAVIVYRPIEVRGVVQDRSGRGVGGAVVTVAGTEIAVETRADGSFLVAACPMGFRVFEASKNGAATGSVRAKVNHTSGDVTVILGQSVAGMSAESQMADVPSDAFVRAQSGSEVTISGRLYYRDPNGVDHPMAGVRAVLQDDATFCWDDLYTTTSDSTGFFSFTYDYDDVWDSWNEPDVRVVAYAEDREADICGVYDGYWSWDPHEFVATSTWNDNRSSRTGLTCRKTGGDAAAWFIYDCAVKAHDRWQQLTGYDREWLWVDYPADIGSSTGQFALGATDTHIAITGRADAWRAGVVYHEYGHSVHYALSYVSPGCNAYAAYSHPGFAFYEVVEGKLYNQKDNGYGIDITEGGPWGALKEGFAEFFAAVMLDWDRGAMTERSTYERNFDVGLGTDRDLDDSRIAHSVSRALWDLYDDAETPLCCTWEEGVEAHQVPRPMGPLGEGDDDLLSNSAEQPFGGTLAKLVYVLRHDFPADIEELYDALVERYSSSQLDHTALQAILYSQGILKDRPLETAPRVVDAVILPGAVDGAYGGLVTVYAQIEDMNGPRDLDRAGVRLEFKYQYSSTGFLWLPLGCSFERLHYAPEGKWGESWYAITWNTVAPSPVAIRFADDFGYAANICEKTIVEWRDDDVTLRLIANDRFTDGTPLVLAPITVDNTVGFGAQAIADAAADYISWAGMESILSSPYTFEFFFTPSRLQAGVLAEYTLGYRAPIACRAPIMRIELTADGRVRFAVNKTTGAGPGGGFWCYAYDPQNPTRLQVGRRYHIAADDGPMGLRLYIDGRLEAAAPYFDYPQPDWSNGTLYGGWFSIGAYETLNGGGPTALGAYDEVRVSDVQRYTGGADAPFLPPTEPFRADSHTMLLDHLDGSTTGENGGMTYGVP
jgi:hypothetical protein